MNEINITLQQMTKITLLKALKNYYVQYYLYDALFELIGTERKRKLTQKERNFIVKEVNNLIKKGVINYE